MLYPEYPFASRYLPLDGGRLHYLDEGDGPAVVMVHGNPTWSYYYRRLITELRQDHRVIAIDHLGCGLSDKPQNYPYRLDRHIAHLELLLNHLQIARFSLVVHDWGGAIGFGCAGRRPADIDRLVVMNTAAFRSSRIPLRIRLCRLPILGQLLVRGLNGFAGPARYMAVSKPLPREVAKAYIAPYDSWQNRVAIAGFVRDIPLTERHPSYPTLVAIEASLHNLRLADIPMLIAWGGRDFCFNDSFYREWVQRFPRAQAHYFPDGGHYVLEDEWPQMRLLLSEFFRSAPSGVG